MAFYTFLTAADLSPSGIWAWAKKLVTDMNTRDALIFGSGRGSSTSATSIAPGMSMQWLGAALPDGGWLWEDGGEYAVASYPSLFSVIGYTYGGSGATFNVRNMTNRIPIGVGSLATLGQLLGSDTVALDVAHLPAHDHAVLDSGHAHDVTDPGHHHAQGAVAGATGAASTGAANLLSSDTATAITNILVNKADAGIIVRETGGNESFSVLNPVVGTHFIVKY